MEKLIIFEQDIIDSVCLYMADQKSMSPEEIEVELMYDDEAYGFSAEVYFNGRSQILAHRDLIEAIRFYISRELNGNPYSGIELVLDDDEGIIAYVNQ
ncbi:MULTISPECIES: DUF2653 family protein [Bacillus]|uniref:DUF2653 family protein n=1 Tax=Bacillus TaxID=1386 RepID=UPI0002E412D8|nr:MULTISPECIES: DUF2653 family protein [Bacillus]